MASSRRSKNPDAVPTAVSAGNRSQACEEDILAQSNIRVLLLEDNHPNAFLFQAFLEKLNIPEAHHVETIAEATDLLPELQSGAYDVVVLDIMLPDGESFGLAEILSRTTDVPVFAYTARTAPQDIARMTQCGFDEIIGKPSGFEMIVDAFATHFPGLERT